MKKLLTTITLSALVGTSASNLKPVLINDVVSHGFKSNQINKDISIKNQNNTNPFITLIIKEKIKSSIIISLPNNCIYVGTKSEGLWKSTDGINLEQVINGIPSNIYITSIAIAPNGTIWVGSLGKGLYKSTDGITFEQLKSGLGKDDFIGSIAVDETGVVYVGSSNYSGSKKTVYKSIDGINFSEISGTTGQIQSLITDSSNNVYAGTTNPSGSEGIIYKSNGTDEFHEIFKTVGAVQKLITDSSNNVYAGTKVYNTKQGFVYKSIDGNTFTPMSGTTGVITSLAADNYNNIYAGTEKGLYKSNGTDEFTKVNEVPDDDVVNSVWIAPNGVIYIGTENKGLYTINPINLLLKITKPDTFDKSWPLYQGIIYNSVQKIDIKENLVASAKLDNKSITIPTTDLDIPSGEHNLVLTLKDKKLASVFGGDVSTGKVTYKLWVKTSIDKKDIQYSTNIDDTDLTDLSLGFIADVKEGKTTYHNSPIIETKNKDGTGTHNASLNIDFKDILIDYPNSFYVQGNVDSSNNFTVTGTHKTFSKNLSIQNDGIYHLHLVDTVGNTYDSYLELGKDNWKLKGTFKNDELDRLKTKLNVIVDLTDPKQLAQATGWLTNYDKFATDLFEKSVQVNGKGFDTEIKTDLSKDFKWFLKSLTYEPNNEPKFDDGLDKNALVKTINDKANEILNKGLDTLPKNLNINTSNVINKSTLEHYTNWITNYQKFINKNKDKWINDIEKIASRGFATTEQENQIKAQVSKFLNNHNIKNYLKSVVWEDNKLLKATSSDYNQFIELDKLQSDTINWVNTNMKDINIAYQQAIKNAESGLNLHGYSISEILNGKQKPQTKNEIDNFAAGQSYHDWLQTQANIKFRGWGLLLGFSIGIPLLLLVVAVAWVIRSRTNPKYRGYWRARQLDKQDKVAEMKKIKNIRKENKGIKKNHDE